MKIMHNFQLRLRSLWILGKRKFNLFDTEVPYLKSRCFMGHTTTVKWCHLFPQLSKLKTSEPPSTPYSLRSTVRLNKLTSPTDSTSTTLLASIPSFPISLGLFRTSSELVWTAVTKPLPVDHSQIYLLKIQI